MWSARPIIKRDSSLFEMPVMRPSSTIGRDTLPGYDDLDAAIGYRRGGGGALLTPPPPQRSQLQPSLSIEKKRKTVRMSESHQYYSDYNNDTDEW